MFDTKFKSATSGTHTRGQSFLAFFNTAVAVQQKFGSEVLAAANRVVAAAYVAKIPEDVMESALREHEGLVGHAFEAARAQLKASAELARNQYASLVQDKAAPCSMLQGAQVNKAVATVEAVVLKAVDKLEDTRKKVVEPFGFPAPRPAKAA